MSKKHENYASDSDESDEDYCPDKADNSSDGVPSEEDSDDPISDQEHVPATKETTKTKKTERNKTSKKPKKPTKEKQEEEHIVATRNRLETTTKSTVEKDELESDEDEDPNRKEALWADFLSDIPTTTPNRTKKSGSSTAAVTVSKKETAKSSSSSTSEEKNQKETVPPKEPEKVVIKQVYDFAGEEVHVEKTVDADSIKATNGTKKVPPGPAGASRGPVKRPGGGLGSILGQLDKKKKISVLEKSKLDWDGFKASEGIEEELQTFNKGKDGYLQRQDFLERTDLRQFEIEKSLRAARRKPM